MADRSDPDPTSRPFDVGLQPERTALAWRRTALALIVAAVVGIRALPTLMGPGAFVPAGAGLAVAVGILIAAHYRYRGQHERLTAGYDGSPPLPDGTLPALVTVVAVLGGLCCAAVTASINLR